MFVAHVVAIVWLVTTTKSHRYNVIAHGSAYKYLKTETKLIVQLIMTKV